MSTMLYKRFADALSQLAEAGQRRRLTTVERRSGPTVSFEKGELVNLSSNDYLGLGSDTSLHRAFFAGACEPDLDAYGMTASASRLLTGNHPAYAVLEQDLSDLYGGKAATVFSSGYHTNVGICSAMANKDDLFLADRLCHASLIDGMRLSGATLLRYRHLDYGHLEGLLKKQRGGHRHVFVVSESVFSMDGDIADIERLVWLKKRHGAMLIMDEAHAVGVFGGLGLGVCERDGLSGEVDVLVGTFGKAWASFGAFAITDAVIKDYLINCMRPLIFTTALPPAVVNWTRTTLARSVSMRRERKQLAELAAQLRRGLRALDVETGGESQIVPVIVGQNREACRLAEFLRTEGFLVFPIRPPTVPVGTARLRFSLTANMDGRLVRRIPETIAKYLHHEKSLDSLRSQR